MNINDAKSCRSLMVLALWSHEQDYAMQLHDRQMGHATTYGGQAGRLTLGCIGSVPRDAGYYNDVLSWFE
jgi:hypothetical protein